MWTFLWHFYTMCTTGRYSPRILPMHWVKFLLIHCVAVHHWLCCGSSYFLWQCERWCSWGHQQKHVFTDHPALEPRASGQHDETHSLPQSTIHLANCPMLGLVDSIIYQFGGTEDPTGAHTSAGKVFCVGICNVKMYRNWKKSNDEIPYSKIYFTGVPKIKIGVSEDILPDDDNLSGRFDHRLL